jgi:hypothetical protein
MTLEEREIVRRFARDSDPPVWSLGWIDESAGLLMGGTCAGLLLAAIPAGLLYLVLWLLRASTAIAKWLWAAGVIVGIMSNITERRRYLVTLRRNYRTDLTEGNVQEIHGTVADAVEVEGWEDDPCFFLDMGDARLLFLDADYGLVHDAVEERRFPNRELRLVISHHQRVLLTFECIGEPFQASRNSSSGLLDRLENYTPQQAEVITGTLATLEDDLRRLAGEKEHQS